MTTKQDQEDQDYTAIEVAHRVYKALLEDGYYGPYVLGDELWNEFDSVFGDEQLITTMIEEAQK